MRNLSAINQMTDLTSPEEKKLADKPLKIPTLAK